MLIPVDSSVTLPDSRAKSTLACHAAKEFLSSHGVPFTAKNVVEDAGALSVATVGCPDCGRVVTLPEGAAAGDEIECEGRRYRLTLEYGAFAAAPADMGGSRGAASRAPRLLAR